MELSILTHLICILIGFLVTYIILSKKTNIEVNVISNQEETKTKNSKEPSAAIVKKIKQIEIDASTIVVNDMDNNYQPLFKEIGEEKIIADNIKNAVDKLSQLKNNGGSNG
jgi:biopolymer transport protein ExbD